MLRSINSLPDDHNGHLRSLIDQRNARADVHGRLSAAVSDFSDSPSVYNRSYFSPRPSEKGDSRLGSAYSSSDVGNAHTSILDLTDDRRSSYVSRDYDNTSSEEVTIESETTARLSYLGPKMRVHSRAPWEEETLEEVDEENISGRSSFSRHAAKSIASAFSSPRPSYAGSVGRQSEDSSLSQPATKQSFETINSQVSLSHTRAGLYSSTRESTSSNSLGRTPVKETFLNKLPIGRLRSETSSTTHVPNTPSPMFSSANKLIPTSAGRRSSPNKTNSPSSSCDSLEFLSARKASTHPYANPELIVSYPDIVQNSAVPSDTHYAATHFGSEVDISEPFPMRTMSKFNALARISIPDSSVNQVGSKVRTSPIRTRNISSPVTAVFSPQNLRPSAERLPGWTERPSAAAFSLISLEEARAKRMRTSTDTDSGTSFPPNCADYITSSPSSPLANLGSRARGRSISAGANAKNALHNFLGQPRSGSDSAPKEDFISTPPSGKTLKNKKSGFLRIFNREKDFQIAPPVPSIPDGISQFQPHLAATNTHRVPVPSLSQPEISTRKNDGSSLQADNLTEGMKRSSPSLSVNATSQGPPARVTTSYMSQTTLGVPAGLQSAPPEIPILKLRPVSMVFSASFGDLVPSGMSEMAGQETPRSCTPPSSSSLLATPKSPSKYLDDFTPVVNDENHPAAKVLQEQMISMKNTWQRHISELEGQVRELKAELEQLKNNDEYCDKCGHGKKSPQDSTGMTRTRTGSSSRFVNHRT